MKSLLPPLGICIIALTGGCADILGADFDRHPRYQDGVDAARDSDASHQDGGDSKMPNPPNADATSEAPTTGDSPPRDAGAWSDVADTGHRFDAHDAIHAGPLRDGSDVEDEGHTRDPRDAAEGGPPHDGGNLDDAGDARDGGNPDDAGDARGGGGNPDDAGGRRDGGKPDDAGSPNDAGDAMDGGDVVDAKGPQPPPDAPRTTGVVGGFVTLGAPNRGFSTIELRGQVISNAAVRGVTSSGISIEGKVQ